MDKGLVLSYLVILHVEAVKLTFYNVQIYELRTAATRMMLVLYVVNIITLDNYDNTKWDF